MELRNLKDLETYEVETETDGRGGFMVYAKCKSKPELGNFVMHYATLAQFTSVWTDI